MTQDRGLGRRREFDERSRAFPIRTLTEAVEPQQRYWRCDVRLDQGQEGACVGFAWGHELNAEPRRWWMTDRHARVIYKRAQQLDQWPGENYQGTSVLAGAKAVMETGRLQEYRWAFGLMDVMQALSAHGPVVLGVDWYESMGRPVNGLLHVEGPIVGGHAILARGLTRLNDEWWIVLRNSWGRGWGKTGDALIRGSDLAYLLEAGGEACVPVVR